MKKLICLFVLIMMIFALAGCNSTEDEHNHHHDHTTEATSQAQVQDTTSLNTDVPHTTDSTPQQTDATTPKQETSQSTAGEDFVQATEYPFTLEATGELMYKHSVKIDIPFEQEYVNAKSYKERAAVCAEYTDEWRTIGERYYKEILFYNGSVPEDPNFSTDEEMHTYIEERKAQWEAEYEENHKIYLESMQQQYSDEYKAQAMCENYKFDLQREFSLELIGVYEMLGEFNNQQF